MYYSLSIVQPLLKLSNVELWMVDNWLKSVSVTRISGWNRKAESPTLRKKSIAFRQITNHFKNPVGTLFNTSDVADKCNVLQVMKDDCGNPRGFGFVCFESHESAMKVSCLHSFHSFCGLATLFVLKQWFLCNSLLILLIIIFVFYCGAWFLNGA